MKRLRAHVLLPMLALSTGGGCVTREPLIIAHRGASYDAPENTLAAFALAFQQGADGIEGDFYLTRDQQVVCLHDPSTGRTAGIDMDCAGSTLFELHTLEVGCWKSRSWHGERIPTLQEVLATVPQGKHCYIEIKCGPGIIGPVAAILERARADPDRIVIISFDQRVIMASKQRMPQRRAYLLIDVQTDPQTGALAPPLEEIIGRATRAAADGVSCRASEQIERSFVDSLEDAGLSLHVWTVNDADTAQHFRQIGAQSITTDRPAWLRQHWQRSATHPDHAADRLHQD